MKLVGGRVLIMCLLVLFSKMFFILGIKIRKLVIVEK